VKGTSIDATGDGPELSEMLDAALHADVGRVVHHQFQSRGPPFLYVQLLPGALLVDRDPGRHALMHDHGAKQARRVLLDPPSEEHLDLGGPPERRRALHHPVEERPCPGGAIENQGAGELDLVHGGLPLVAGFEVPGSEWERDALHGSLEEVLELAGAQLAAGPAQRPGIVRGGEAIGKGDVADALLLELALHPLMPVAPELGRVWE